MTEGLSASDVAKVATAARNVPAADYPGGWPNQIEAALIDAVLSIQARYGGPSSGVRAAIKRYRAEVGGALDKLDRLAAFDPELLANVLINHQKTSGELKSKAIVHAAHNLVNLGVRRSKEVDRGSQAQKAAYTSVRGLGWITWDYFVMNLGHPGVKADTWIVRWVESVLGRPSSSEEARALILAAADSIGADPIALDYAIWDHMSGRKMRRRN